MAASTSLGLLGVIARVKFAVVADFKVYANQTMQVIQRLHDTTSDVSCISLDEDDVLEGDIYAQISPYVTANYWARISFTSCFLGIKLHLLSGGQAFENSIYVRTTLSR